MDEAADAFCLYPKLTITGHQEAVEHVWHFPYIVFIGELNMASESRCAATIFSILLILGITALALADVYYVQVSSQRSESEAIAAYRALQSKFPNQLAKYEPLIHRADLSQGSFFRAMVGPFKAGEEAANLCSALMAAGGVCLIQRGDSASVATPTAPKAASDPQPSCYSIQDSTARLSCYDAANKRSTTKPLGTKAAAI